MPVETVTSIIWGGPKLDILFVTTSLAITDYTTSGADLLQLASSPWRGQTLMITGLGDKGVAARRLKNYF